MAQLYDPGGAALGPSFSAVQPYLGDYIPGPATALGSGGYALLYGFAGALLPGQLENVATFTADGQLLATAPLSLPAGQSGLIPVDGSAQIHALPDGGFLASWVDAPPFSGSGEAVIREFDAAGNPVGDSLNLGPVAAGAPGVQVTVDGHYVVSWTSPSGAQQETFQEAAAPLGAAAPALATEAAATLAASTGWTGAAVLSNHALAVVASMDGGYGSHTAGVETYDASGDPTGAASSIGYGGAGQAFAPQITALQTGGFYEVSFAGSTDYAIFNAANRQVFVHNAYTSPNGTFIPLSGGGYAVADFPDHVVGLFNAAGANTAWASLAGFSQPETIASLSDGGFAFGYGDSVTGLNAAGQQAFSDPLGASKAAGFASDLASLSDGRLAEVWLSPDGGQGGLPTTIALQVFGPAGATGVLQLGQDLDPWHTTFAIQAHADGSAAVLWSEGGGIFGMEYGAALPSGAHAALAGDLSSTIAIPLAYDDVGFAYLQGGDVWAEVFNPLTGAVSRADLGASAGDLSTVHALATADGGIAVSWHGASGVVGAAMDPWGHVGAATGLAGDFLGVDGQGHAITLHDLGGQPVLQTYAEAGGGLFWAA